MPHPRIPPKTTHVLLAAVLMAMLITPFAVAQSGGSNSSGTRIAKDDPRYAFLARNTRAGDGGAGALACNSDIGSGREPCLNMVNKGNGLAAAFRTRGLTGFRLQTSGNGTATPFILDKNATGKVEFLNADQLDGLSVEQIRPLFARVSSEGAAATGANGVTAATRTGTGRYQVTFNRDISACALHVTSAEIGGNRTTAVTPLAANNAVADVAIRRAGTSAEGDPVDSPFSITANC
jgi:hypothetical protein